MADQYPPKPEWKLAMEAALKRTGRRLFESGKGIAGGYYVTDWSRAWCCAAYTPSSTKSQGPQKTKAHLRTVNHFRDWCLQHKEAAIEMFPEVKPLFAEYELTKVDRAMGRSDIVSTTSVNINTSRNLPLGHGIP